MQILVWSDLRRTPTITQEIQSFDNRWRNKIAVTLPSYSTIQYGMLSGFVFVKVMYLIYLMFSVNTLATILSWSWSWLKLKQESRFVKYTAIQVSMLLPTILNGCGVVFF